MTRKVKSIYTIIMIFLMALCIASCDTGNPAPQGEKNAAVTAAPSMAPSQAPKSPSSVPQASMPPKASETSVPSVKPEESNKPVQTEKPAQGQETSPKSSAEPVLIGEFSTPIVDNTPSRLKNLQLACEYINGDTVESGGEFSFNGSVGARTEERGFEYGYVFVGDEKRQALGGGICQISSTLYNAVMNAGLEVVERHPHRRKVDYIKAGQDATVQYGKLDFRFANTLNTPVKVEAYVAAGKAVVQIWKL